MDRWDVLTLIGCVCLGVGLWLLAPWLGLTVVGVTLLTIGLSGSVLSERTALRRQIADARGQRAGDR
ncbi:MULTISPECIES: hypothetical protein [unclassified Streptomyces]|uniref:hypothetical protein n=1 Tax=unclassified Streptomyces TaxID=2593676 RepID=UPI003D7573D1